MLSARPLVRTLLVVGLLAAGAASARAQELDGKWFKLKVTSKGVTVNAADNDKLVPDSFSTTAYMLFTFNAGVYDYSTWTQTTPGVWAESDSGTLQPLIANESIATDDFLLFDNLEGGLLMGYVTSRITIKHDKDGNFVSATFKALGGEAIDDSSMDGVNDYRGNILISGKTVDPSKLPFTPV